MIFFFGVDLPNCGLVCYSVFDAANSLNGREHGVVHIVVFVLTVSTDAPEIAERGKILAYLRELRVNAEISGISLFELDASGVKNIGFIDNSDRRPPYSNIRRPRCRNIQDRSKRCSRDP